MPSKLTFLVSDAVIEEEGGAGNILPSTMTTQAKLQRPGGHVSKHGAERPQKPYGLLRTGERHDDDDDEVMLNVLRCQLTY